MPYWKSVGKVFLDAFRLDIRFVFVLVYDILFFLLLAGVGVLGGKALGSIASGFTGINTSIITAETAAAVKSFFVTSIAAILGFLALVFIIYAVLQALAWATIIQRRPTIKYLVQFFLLNFGWLIGWTAVGWFFTAGLQGGYVTAGVIVLAILFTHLTFVMQHAFVFENKGIKASMGRAFSLGLGGIHRFIVPYLLAAAVFFIWAQLWRLVPVQTPSGFAFAALACIIFAPFLAWLKFYLHALLQSFAHTA
jgi:hypothetical protein